MVVDGWEGWEGILYKATNLLKLETAVSPESIGIPREVRFRVKAENDDKSYGTNPP
jgi:hypothetical protein